MRPRCSFIRVLLIERGFESDSEGYNNKLREGHSGQVQGPGGEKGESGRAFASLWNIKK